MMGIVPKRAGRLSLGWVERNETHNQAWGCVYAPVGWTQPTDKKIGQEDGSTACDPDPADVDGGRWRVIPVDTTVLGWTRSRLKPCRRTARSPDNRGGRRSRTEGRSGRRSSHS